MPLVKGTFFRGRNTQHSNKLLWYTQHVQNYNGYYLFNFKMAFSFRMVFCFEIRTKWRSICPRPFEIRKNGGIFVQISNFWYSSPSLYSDRLKIHYPSLAAIQGWKSQKLRLYLVNLSPELQIEHDLRDGLTWQWFHYHEMCLVRSRSSPSWWLPLPCAWSWYGPTGSRSCPLSRPSSGTWKK